jgi:hypothetical protein
MLCQCERSVDANAGPTGTTMTLRKIANRLQLSTLLVVSFAALIALAHSARADEPTASGLWEKSAAGKPVVWVLIFEHGDTYEGAIAKRFHICLLRFRRLQRPRQQSPNLMIAGVELPISTSPCPIHDETDRS